jgi:hypothetical protein
VYQSNDDIALRLIAEGEFVRGEGPSALLLNINVIVGKLLATLYTIAPGIPWYDVVMLLSLCAAAGALLWAWGRRELPWTLLFAVVLLLPLFLRMHYTVAAMSCAAGGVALLARNRPLLASILLVWGTLLRFEAAMLIVLLAAPFLLARWRVLIVACAIAVSLFGVNRLVYRMTPGWEEFYELDSLRRQLGEYLPEARITPVVLTRLRTEAGWSANDHALFADWFHLLYSIDEARRAAAIIDTRPSLEQGLESLLTFIRATRWPLLLLAAWALGRSRPTLLRWLAIVAAMLLLVMVLGMIAKPPPPWISLPIVVCGAALLRSDERPRRWVMLAALMLGVLIAGRQIRGIGAASPVRALIPVPAGKLAILHGGAYPYEANWRPFRKPRQEFAFLPLAGSAHMPPVRNAFRKLDLCGDPDVVLVAYPHVPRRLERYYAERGRAVRFEAVSANVWRCTPVPTPH